MAEELNRNNAQEAPEGPEGRYEHGDPRNDRLGSQLSPTSGPVGDSPAKEQSEAADEGRSSDASLGAAEMADPNPPGAPGTDCGETPLVQNAQVSGSFDPDRTQEAKGEDTEPEGKIEDPQSASADPATDDPFTRTDYTAMDKLIDALALASHEDSLARGDNPDRMEPDREWYEPLPTIDLVREDGWIKISHVEWNGPIPKLTTYPSPVTYQGRVYERPSLPNAMYRALFFPTDVTADYSARKVFDEVYTLLQGSELLSDEQAELLTFWIIATWFSDALDFIPRLTVTGPRYAADLLFRLLSYVCRRAVLLVGIKPAILKQIPIADFMPTLLIHVIKPGKSAEELLDASDHKGYFFACGGELKQFYCPKCVYIGAGHNLRQEVDGLHIHLGRNVSLPARPYRSAEAVQRLQNLLFTYRSFNIGRLQLQPTPEQFLPTFAAAGRRLGAVIFDDVELQGRAAEVLQEQNEQMRVDRASGVEGMVLKAVLALAHQDEPHVYARDIAVAANQICIEQGESLKLTPEKVGHTLKQLGLYTRSLKSKGRGLVLDKPTQIRLHQLSLEYDVLPIVPECAYCHNLQAPPLQEVM